MARGRTLSARNQKFAHIPVGLSGLYLIDLGNGVVKVGRSIRLRDRLISWQCEANRAGREIGRYAIFPGHYAHEVYAISVMTLNAKPVKGCVEYFTGISFDDAHAHIGRVLPELETA
jgi:hypothetical protein